MSEQTYTPPDPGSRPSKKFGPKLLLGTLAVTAFIALWEGGTAKDGSSVVYADKLAGGVPTVCHGLTKSVTSTPIIVGQRWSAQKCTQEEQKAIIKVQTSLETCFRRMPPQPVFDAATDHAWNNGVGNTCGSLAMQAWNQGDWDLGCRRLAYSDAGKRVWSYVRVNGVYKFVQGLANRRDAEYRLCLTGKENE